MKQQKTNVMRLLDSAGIRYEAKCYTPDEDDLSGTHIAEQIGLPPEQVFKTLVLRGERHGVSVFCLPADRTVDLKRAAELAGEKKIEMVPVRELLALTGYIRGGCSPIGMRKQFPVFIENSCRSFERITISAGVRGIQLLIRTDDLIRFTGAKEVSVAI